MLKKIFTLIAATILCLASLTACAGDKYSKIDIEGTQDTSYTVVGNGGSAVQYGNYVYFLNGTRGYEDASGEANVFGEVTKGALYRAELLGTKDGGDFIVKNDTTTKLGLKSTEVTDYKNDKVNSVNVSRVAPKTIGTSGYKNGGIFIYDNNIYYASPNNLKNKAGEVQYLKTDFFRMSIDGKTTEKIYETENDSNTSPYAFYKQGDAVYLVVLDGTDLISVKIDAKGKAGDPYKIAENVKNAVLPVKPVYNKSVSTNTIYDYVFFERDATKDDMAQTGEILEFARPDGSVRTEFEADGNTDYTLETVEGGLLFFRKSFNYENRLYARNLHDAFKLVDSAYNSGAASMDDVNRDVTGEIDDLDNLDVIPFVSGYEFGKSVGASVNVLTLTKASDDGSSSSLSLTLYVDGAYKTTVFGGTALSVDVIKDDVIYFTADSKLYGFDVTAGADMTAKLIASGISGNTYGADVAGGYLVFMMDGVQGATAYTHFYEINGLEGHDERTVFVGELLEDDEPTSVETITVTQAPTKTTYAVGDELDLTGIVVEATYYADKEGNRPEAEEIEVTSDMISGFDTSTGGEKTVTVTYKKRTATFTVTVSE